MNREIKFRGKRIDTGQWITGGYVEWSDIRCNKYYQIVSSAGYHNDVIPGSVGQFTGLKDKNGADIYEGDVISVNGKYPKIVKYIDDRCAFCLANIDDLKHEGWKDIWQQPSPDWWCDFSREIKVIGNIHNNPELLTGNNQ
jgi:uncharacterized phage protein (TIGR01671 family)